MSWLSDFLGTKRLKLPKVTPPTEMLEDEYDYGIDAYLRSLERKSGFEDTIKTGGKKPKLAAKTFLGAV